MKAVSRKPVETAPNRLGALAKLPVFLDLVGQRAIVCGGSAAAGWKAEALAAAGAHVTIFAADVSTDMRDLVERGAAAGSLQIVERDWTERDLPGAAIAVGDLNDDSEASAFVCAARAAGIMVNVIDKPALCQFQFGSIVNRSPVVIGIATDGAAPVLAQAIRRRIETLLPSSLAAWAGLAKQIRAEVSRLLPTSTQRRTFWQRFAERAFGPAPDARQIGLVDKMVDDLAHNIGSSSGRVTLVGAGPGDAELLTLKAVRALQAADVILYDDLVSDEVLELARREAKRMLVGKRGRRESCKQDDINAMMVKLARQGHHVVRLKSGDPMVFGRAGEEIALLKAAGIPVEVVAGITAASALASATGISLTHRDMAHSVRFVTGHSRAGELPGHLDWRGLADPQTTLVVYMGGRTSPRIAERLLDHGLDADTPVCVASSVGRRDMALQATTLADLWREDMIDGLDGPVLIGIGQVFASLQAAEESEPNVCVASAMS
jgi:uroporphyrin-III C-methyltransferase/precorrin-2 dehydrogenase/sirohydrochlorin ferrochelatase